MLTNAPKAALFFLSAMALVMSLFSNATTNENVHENAGHIADVHKEHQRVGYHGMVVFTDNTHVYASHLPLYRAPHDYQIVYKLETEHQQQLVNYLTREARTDGEAVVTLLPEQFDLNLLTSANQTQSVPTSVLSLQTQFFKGHFERGGQKWLLDENVKYATPILVAPLVVADKPSHKWWHSPLEVTSKGETESLHLYTHKIDSKPSYDALVIGQNCNGEPKASLETVPNEASDILTLFSHCDNATMAYFDTQDFQ